MSSEIEMSISCRDCVRRATTDCDDCLVSFVLGSTPGAVEFAADDAALATLLSGEGMIPRLKFVAISPRRH
ncbi:MAG: hypothetical protein WCJ82_07670 [Actinomycetota bacterium]|jgi:hypothetical protein